MIEVKNLVKRYGNHCAVDHLSFTVEDGQVFGLLGPNGAGKSTTMNIMTGYLAATEGDVVIQGHNILEEPEAARKCVGYLPEIPPLYPDMTVLEYLRFCAELKKLPPERRQEDLDEVLSLTHLDGQASRLIRNLSKGYRQRVGLAQAILGFPPIIILDEATASVDPENEHEIQEAISALVRGKTIITIAHRLATIQNADRILVVEDGRIAQQGTHQELMSQEGIYRNFIEIRQRAEGWRI